MLQKSAFQNVVKKSKKLKSLFYEYRYLDILKAFFCIAVDRNNRSALENCLSMNQALLDYVGFCHGKKAINSYQDFQEFFSKVKRVLPITYYDDYTIPDFGEVRVIFDGKAYKTFVGTGHTQIFSCLSYLEGIAIASGEQELIAQALKYQDTIIRFFEDVNEVLIEEGTVSFDVPSEKIYHRTEEFFHEYDSKGILFLHNRVKDFSVIENKHFVEYNNYIYPLFNTSIVVDVISSIVEDESIVKNAVEVGLYDFFNHVEQFAGNEKGVFAFPAIFIKDGKPIKGSNISFVITTDSGAIAGIDYETWENEKDILLKIFDANDSEIDIVELRRRYSQDGNLAVHISNPRERLRFMVYYPILDINENHFFPLERMNNVMEVSSLDLIDILHFSDDMNEIWDYISFECNNSTEIFSLGGKAGEFFAWKENGHYFEKGAISFGSLTIDYNSEIGYIWDYYRNQLRNYPWDAVSIFLFSNPFIWRVLDRDNSIDEYVSKCSGVGGQIVTIGDISLFFFNNVEYYKKESEESINYVVHSLLPLLEDIFFRMINSLNSCISKMHFSDGILIQFVFMPKEYFKRVNTLNLDENTRYIQTVSHYSDGVIQIQYTVNDKVLFENIKNASNRSVECEVVLELIKSLNQYNPSVYDTLVKMIESMKKDKKQVDVFQVGIRYLWNQLAMPYSIDNQWYYWVRKRIAYILANHDIEAGEYFGKDANKVIRSAQKNLILDFESLVNTYSMFDLQIILESIYSNVIHNISVHRTRYGLISDVQQDIQDEIKKKIIREREEFKHQKRVLEYLMETNLYLARSIDRVANKEEIEQLLAYANWLVVLSDNADICHFTDDEAHIEVSFENVMYVIGDYDSDKASFIANRLYDDGGYATKGDEIDQQCFKEVKEAFESDTGVLFDYLIDFLGFLSWEISEYNEIVPDVFLVDKEKTKQQYLSIDGVNCSNQELEKIIDFLTIQHDKLKTIKGKEDYYLPIGRRNDRDNRIELKCLWVRDNDIIYSPVMSHFTQENWFRGFIEYFPPYTIGLDNTIIALDKWKNRYEKEIVFDIEKMFIKNGISCVYHNFDPRKMDKEDKSLLLLGDYDVLAIDNNKKKIWMIECKVLSKVASFHDMYMQQQRFFKEHKEDEHFQRRIDYMKKNYNRILNYLGAEDANSTYEVVPYMVVNKVLIARYKKVKFPIISYYELEELLENADK